MKYVMKYTNNNFNRTINHETIYLFLLLKLLRDSHIHIIRTVNFDNVHVYNLGRDFFTLCIIHVYKTVNITKHLFIQV